MSLSPWFRSPDASSEDQVEKHKSDGDTDTPCEVQPGKVNNDRNSELLKWNQQFPKPPLVSGKECTGWSLQRSASPCCSAEHVSKQHAISGGHQPSLHFQQCISDKDLNYVFSQCLYLSRFLGLQNIFLPLRLILSFLCLWEKTSYSVKPRRAAVSVLQNPHLPTSLSSILLYLIYCLLTDHMGNTLGKHASGFTFRINTFYDYSHDLQQQTRLVTHNYV